MKQLLQHLRTGQIEVAELPCPAVRAGSLLVQTRASLISAGTERMLVEFSQAGWLSKIRQQPEKVKQVLDKIKTDGLLPTLEAVFRKLDQPMPLGYSNAGVVLEVGAGVQGFAPGDRVVSNGPHAEVVCVPRNLCAKVHEGVSDEQASFTVVSAIGLQGIRLLAPALGEKYVVYGLGLIGLLCVQLLRAHGCEVLGIDINPRRLELAERCGAAVVNAAAGGDPIAAAEAWTGGKGVDGVLITASAHTDEIVHNAARMCRKRGRIVLVGVVGLNLRRDDLYEKELTFQVSCSYGPGRYDEKYEQGGQDYPYGFVRWTEQRNFEAVLSAMHGGVLRVDDLVTHRFSLDKAAEAYAAITDDPGVLGVVLQYPSEVRREPAVRIGQRMAASSPGPRLGVIGAGNFSSATLMPSLAKISANVKYVADINVAAARHLASKYRAEQAVTDYKLVLHDPEVTAVFIAVGPSLHARFVCECLQAGKHVFVEKPLATNEQELQQVIDAAAKAPDRLVMVGFNRRFSPLVVKMKQLLTGRSGPLCMTMTVNAGYIPPEHWVHDPAQGGRIISEGCHFIDLMAFLADSSVATVSAAMVGAGAATREDKMSIVLGFEDGSIGTVNYFANGPKSYPKETLEVFSDNRVLRLENFRRLLGYAFVRFSKSKRFRQDKGHGAEFAAFVDRVARGGEPLIPFDQLVNVTRASFAAVTAANEERTICVL